MSGTDCTSIARADTDRLIHIDSAYSPEQVIEIQLFGLQASKDDITAIEQVWVFAHPDNKRATGPLVRFARLFTYPAYAPMVGHKGYSYELLAKDDRTARFRELIRAGGTAMAIAIGIYAKHLQMMSPPRSRKAGG